jgi:hypothetical protein
LGNTGRLGHNRDSAVRTTNGSEGRFRVAEWLYRIHRIEVPLDADLDDQIEKVLLDYGTKGWELVQVLHRQPGDPIYRLIFKAEKPLD